MKILLVILAEMFVTVDAKLQKVDARGIVKCFGKPFAGALVELWEKDRSASDAPDDLLAAQNTSSSGGFYVKGSDDEELRLQTFLRIIHTCNVPCKGCYRILVKELNNDRNGEIPASEGYTFYSLELKNS